jgi:P4 family phage/plasmid primase-like protien
MKVFARKATAIKYLKPHQIICNDDIRKYFILNSYPDFADLINSTAEPHFYEFIRDTPDTFVNLFLDIEIYRERHPTEFETADAIVGNIKTQLTELLGECRVIILKSHNELKRSFHIIARATADGEECYFRGVKSLKGVVQKAFSEYCKQKLIDLSVYREGLFRTFGSSKSGEWRPLVVDEQSDDFSFVDTFVGYCLGDKEIVLGELNKLTPLQTEDSLVTELELSTQQDLQGKDIEVIKRFVRKFYKYRTTDIREVFIDRSLNCIIVALEDTFCYNIDREHKSNHQYIVIDTYSSKQKCHDTDCREYKHEEVKIKSFPKEINEIILKCLKVNRQEQELIERAIGECKEYITSNFDDAIDDIQFDRAEMVFKGDASDNRSLVTLNGKCSSCLLEHRITTDGYCLKCKVCDSIYPKNQLIPLDERYKNLNKFWMNYNQLVNNGTFIINNYYNGEEEFSCDVQLDNSIFRNKELTKMYNQILDGHKVVLLSQLMSTLEVDFKYTNGQWYFFNGSIWKEDRESLELRKKIVKLSGNFNKIQQFYETRKAGDTSNTSIIKNIKSLVNKLHKTGFEDEIIKGAKMYYNDESFIKNLNSKKHLVPFTNGVYDLLENRFRATTKEDYINLITAFEYDLNVQNKEVYEFIEKILPNRNVRDYVLKKMSECLNGDIPNTNFLMFIGDGANGKSQLLNLMKLAMGEFGEKVEVTLLTRKRNNANEANTEKIKLMNKRFAFLSEPEDGEKINIGLLKELTGSEEIVARGLYQESVSFVMEAKLFLACNELPDIKGEDTALWRRIRVIDFPSRFVDEPKEGNEYKIDRTLPSRMREDPTWRQTFMNILISYYSKDFTEPREVQVKTNEYRQENDQISSWMDENIKYEIGKKLYLKDVCNLYFENKAKVGVKEKSKFKKELEKSIKNKYPTTGSTCMRTTHDGVTFQGWLDFVLREDDNNQMF